MRHLLISASFMTILVMVLNFIFKVFLSYKVSKDELALFYTFMDLISIGIVLLAGFKDSLIKEFDQIEFEKVVYWYILTFWTISIFIFICEIVYYQFYFNKVFSPYLLLILLFLNANMLFISYYNMAFKVYKVMLFENIIMAISLIFSFLIFNMFFSLLSSLIYASIFSYISRSIYIITFSKAEVKYVKSSFSEVKTFLSNTILSSLMYFFSTLFIGASSIVLLNTFHDTQALGDYQVVVKSIFFALVAILSFPIATYTFPELSKFIAQKNYNEVKRLDIKLHKYLGVFFILTLLSTFFTKWGVTLIFPSDFSESYKMLNILLPLLPFIAYTSFAINILKGFNHFDLALIVRIGGSILFFSSVSLFYLFDFDANSIVYALDLSFFGMFIHAYYYKKKLLNKKGY